MTLTLRGGQDFEQLGRGPEPSPETRTHSGWGTWNPGALDAEPFFHIGASLASANPPQVLRSASECPPKPPDCANLRLPCLCLLSEFPFGGVRRVSHENVYLYFVIILIPH